MEVEFGSRLRSKLSGQVYTVVGIHTRDNVRYCTLDTKPNHSDWREDTLESTFCPDDGAVTEGRKDDHEKPQLDLLPPRAILELGNALTYGAKKYGPDNWRAVPNLKKRYLAAALRHVFAYCMGEERDPESGLHHLGHALCSLSFVLEAELE